MDIKYSRTSNQPTMIVKHNFSEYAVVHKCYEPTDCIYTREQWELLEMLRRDNMNINNETDCDFCIHKFICKREERYTASVNEVRENGEDFVMPELDYDEYTICCRCSDYRFFNWEE